MNSTSLAYEQQPLTHCKAHKGTVKNIRIDLLGAMSGNLLLVKAIAMAIFVKNHLRDSRVQDYTPNRLRDFIGQHQRPLHHTTVKKYVDVLLRADLARMEGKDLIFGSLSDRRGKFNLSLGNTSRLTIAELENELLAAQVVLIVKRKEFAKRLIERATNPKRTRDGYQDFKQARQKCFKYGYTRKFHDHGLSYKTIARRLGVSLQKAEEVIRYATTHGLLVKHTHQEQFFAYGIGGAAKYADSSRHSAFCTKNNVYIVYANTYSLPYYPTGNN